LIREIAKLNLERSRLRSAEAFAQQLRDTPMKSISLILAGVLCLLATSPAIGLKFEVIRIDSRYTLRLFTRGFRLLNLSRAERS
jgi:hypothetical protein